MDFHVSNPKFSTTGPSIIGGTGGSGTRVVARIVRHGGLFIGTGLSESEDVPEFGDYLDRWINKFLPFWRSSVSPHFESEMLGELASFIEKHLASRDPDIWLRWGWKDPRAMYLLPFFDRHFPSLRFLHVIRDGRDMAYSQNQNQLNKHGAMFLDSAELQWDKPLKSIALWQRANMRVADYGEQSLPGRYMRIRFEELCANPVPVIERIFDFFNLDGDARTISETEIRVPGSAGRWRRENPEIAEELHRLGQDGLRRFGYVPEFEEAEEENATKTRVPQVIYVLKHEFSSDSIVLEPRPSRSSEKDGRQNRAGRETSADFVVRLSDEVLAAVQATWDEPPAETIDWENDRRLIQVKRKAQWLIRYKLTSPGLQVLSIPFPAVTLPFWQSLLPSTKCLVCIDEPLRFASTLKRYKGFSLDKGIYLWLIHTASALELWSTKGGHLVLCNELGNNLSEHLRSLERYFEGMELHRTINMRRASREIATETDYPAGVGGPDESDGESLTLMAKALYTTIRAQARRDPRQTPETEDDPMPLCRAALATASKLREARAQLKWQTRVGGIIDQQNRSLQIALDEEKQAWAKDVARLKAVTEESERCLQEMQRLQGALADLNGRFEKSAKQLNELRAAQSGLLWDLFTGYRNAKDRVFPVGSRRRTAYDICLGAIKRVVRRAP